MAGRPEDRAPRLDNPSEAGVLPDTQEGRDEGRVSSAAHTEPRCTLRKHVIENGTNFCDCGEVMIGQTAAKNARVVTLFTVNTIERTLAREVREAIKP